MENNKKGPPRARLPNYCRSAYKIFFEEKRAEILNLRLRACDEPFEREQSQVQVESIMSFSQLTLEINQMWENLSSQDRNRFKARAMMGIKRQRVAKKQPKCTTDDLEREVRPWTQPKVRRKSFEVSSASNVVFDTLEGSVTELLADGSMSGPTNLSIAPDPSQMVAYTMQQLQTSPSSPTSNQVSNTVAASSPWTFHQPLGGAQRIHTNAPMTLQHSPSSSSGMGVNLSASFLLGSSQGPLTLAPTTSNPLNGGHIVPSSYSHNGPPFGFLSTAHYYPAPLLHSVPSGYGIMPTCVYGQQPISYFFPYGYNPMSHHPSYSQPFYSAPTAYYSFGNPHSEFPNSSIHYEPVQGSVTDLSQSTPTDNGEDVLSYHD